MLQTDTPQTRIVKEARNQFFSRGYVSVSMSDIAKELGMSKKTLYLYFTSKEDLLIAGIDNFKKEMRQALEAIQTNESIAFPDKTSQMFTLISNMLRQINPVMLEDIKKYTPQFWIVLEKANAEIAYSTFNSLLEDGIRKGFIRSDVNQHLAVLLYISIIDSLLNPEFIQKIPQALRQEITFAPGILFDGLINIVMKGIMNK